MANKYIDYLESLEDDDEKKKKKNQGTITTQTPEKPSGNKYLDYVREREKDKPVKSTTKTTVVEPEPTKNFLERAKEIVSNVFKKKDEEEVKQQQVTEQAQVGIKTNTAKDVNAPESDEQIDAVMNELLTQEQQKFIDQKKPPKNLFNVDLNKAYDDILLQNLESRYIKLNAEHQSEKPRQKVMDRLETEIQEIESAVNDSGSRKLNVAHKYGTARVSEKAKATIAGAVKSILDFVIVAPTELDTYVRTKSAIKEEATINKALDEMKVFDPAKRQEYIEKFSSRYQKNPLRPNEATLAEKAKEMEKAKAEGQKGLKVVLEKYIADQEPANPTLADDIVGAITSMATFYGAGVVAGIGKVASVAPTVLESVQEAGSVYDTNRKNGLDPDESIKQMYKDFVGNLLWNHYANKFSRIFDGDDKLAKTFKDKVFKTINAMKWEGIQEAGQQFQSNVFTYAEDVFDGVMKSFGLGALVSGGVTAVTVQTESPDTSEGKLYRGVNKDRKQSKIPYEEGVTFYTTDKATAEDYANAQEDDGVKDLKQQRDEVKKKLVEDKESVELKDQLDALNQQIKDRQTEISKNPESKKTKENTGTVVEVNNPLENPLVVDARGQTFDQVNKSAIEQARKEGRDGVVIHNVIDSINTKNAKPITTVLVFNQENIVNQKIKDRQTEISKNPESKKVSQDTGKVIEIDNPLTNPLVVDGKQIDPLITEARKYKSADEFVKSNDLIFQGGKPGTTSAFWSTKIGEANAYASQKGLKDGEIRVARFSDLDPNITGGLSKQEWFAKYGSQIGGNKELNPKIITSVQADKTGLKGDSQLTDIWNQATKITRTGSTLEDQLEDGDIDAFEYQEAVNNDRKKDSYRSQADYNAVAPSNQKQEQKQKKESAEEEVKFTGYNTTESARELTKNISPIEFPELLRMARLISGNKTLVKKLRSRMGGTVLGQHQAGKITLNPEIFEDSELVAKVFAHEFGHMVDFFPDRSMDRGNILGRVASLRGYMGKFLSEYEGAEGKPLTPKEREALRKQAKQLADNPVSITTEEIIGNETIDPKDVLGIWNDATSGIKNPELLQYIQKLSDAQKKQIVVSAMKGEIPSWVTFKKSVKKTITQEVIKNSPEDIKKIFNKLVKNEVYKRRLFEAEVMTEELKNNTRLWSPFDPTVSPRYTAYRYSSKELYAEALSVLFNDPQLLQKNAPTFYTGFFNYMDAKPEVYKALSDVYSLIASGSDAVLDARQAEINESFKLAEDKWRLARENKGKRDVDLMFELKTFWMERHTKLFDKVKEAQKNGAVIPANENPRYFLEEMTRDGAVLKTYFSEQIQPIHDTLNASQISWDDLGSVLLYERVINERGELANPFGQNPKTAQAGLDRMKAQMGSTKWEVLQTQLKAFRKATDYVLKEAEKEGFYKKELLEKMKANPAYATFQVVDYIDSDFATSAVYEQVGTLSGIANAGTSTVMKNLAILNAIEKNKAKRAVVKFMNGFHKEDIVEAPYVYNATKKIREPRAPRDPKLGIIELMDGGNKRGFYVDKYIAKSFEFLGAKDMNVLLKALNFVNTKQFRPMVITFNLGFQSVNLMRDFIRTYKALPTYNLPRVLARYVQAIPASARRAWDVPDKTITEMNKIKALGVTYNDIMQGATAEDTQIDALIDKLGKSPVRTSSYNILKRPFVSILGTIEKLGDTIETLPKVASYNELKGKLPEKELSHFIRTQVGSPDFWAGGTGKAFTNNVFLFSNAIIQGIRADIHTATDPSTRTGWWVKTAMLSLMPKLLMYAVLNGLMGDDEDKKVMEMATEFDRSNYTIIPLGIDENGQGNYMRIPQDETGKIIGAVFWKMITASSNDQEILKDVADIVNTMGGQVPSMSPYLKTLTTTAQFLQGQNPYDTFRGRNIIPDTEFQAGGKYALKPFLTWQLNNLGAGVVFNTQYTTQAPETRTWAQKAQETPVLGNLVSRWFRTTSYGQVEKNRQIINNVRQQKAKERIEKNLKVQDAVTLYKEGNQSISARTKIERQLVADVVGKPPYRGARKTQVTNVIKQFRISLVKGKADPTINSLISAVSNEEKFELLREVKPTLSKEEYIKLRTDLLKYKIVSGDVFKKLEREVK